MSSLAFWIVAALVLAGWLIAHAINSAMREVAKFGDAMRQVRDYFLRQNRQARERGELSDEVEEKSHMYTNHFGKVVLYPPNGEQLVYEFPASDSPDEIPTPLDSGVQRQPDGTLKIWRFGRPNSGLPSLNIETTLPCAVFAEETRLMYKLQCRICKRVEKVDKKTYNDGLTAFSYVCASCKADDYQAKTT
jgi:hypothetical protein